MAKVGFISFKGVHEWKDLEGCLKKVKVVANTLHINVANFAVGNAEIYIRVQEKGDQNEAPTQELQAQVVYDRPLRSGVSYGDVVGETNDQRLTNKVIRVDLVFNALTRLYGLALVVRTSEFKVLINLRIRLMEKGFKGIKYDGDDLSVECVGILVGDGRKIIDEISLS
ncbi:hypothetical protein Hanom_Chr16g01480841 [Helianthus anomalus]